MRVRSTLLAIVLSVGVIAMSFGASAGTDLIFKDTAGRLLTREDLKGVTGIVNWEISSTGSVPAEARKLHEAGRVAGQRGDSSAALANFERAALLAPHWPYPVYDAAFTFLLQRQYVKAHEYYRRVDQMAPRGFFTAKTAVHTLQRERAGTFPEGTYLQFLSIEWLENDAERMKAARAITEKVPTFAPGWKARSSLEPDARTRLAYVEKGLALEPDAETRGFLLMNKAILLHESGRKAEAIAILGTLALDPASPIDVEVLAKKTLATMISR
jgi:tetratricopeptide (TPR) repeat protein